MKSTAVITTPPGSTSRPAINAPHQFRLNLGYCLTDNDQVLFAGRIEGRRGRRDDFQAIKPIGMIREDEIPLHRLVSDFGRYSLLPTTDEIFRAFVPTWGSRVTLDPEVSPVRRKNLTVSFRGLIEVWHQSEPIALLGAQIGVEISGLKMILVERGTSVGYDEVYPMPAFERAHGKDFRADANAFFDDLQARLAGL
jgi:hypothetical protein